MLFEHFPRGPLPFKQSARKHGRLTVWFSQKLPDLCASHSYTHSLRPACNTDLCASVNTDLPFLSHIRASELQTPYSVCDACAWYWQLESAQIPLYYIFYNFRTPLSSDDSETEFFPYKDRYMYAQSSVLFTCTALYSLCPKFLHSSASCIYPAPWKAAQGVTLFRILCER
jgi:hypothetical protein